MSIKNLAIIALSLSAPLVASSEVIICMPNVSLSTAVGIEALYWKPCNAPLQYGQIDSEKGTTANGKVLLLAPDAQWGFRLYGTIADECNCNFAAAEWAYVQGTNSLTQQTGDSHVYFSPLPDFLVSTGAPILSSQRTLYNKVSLKVGHRFSQTDCGFIYGYAGGRWAEGRIRQTARSQADSGELFFQPSSRFSGGGFEAGVGAYYEMWCGFGIVARAGLLGLWGGRRLIVGVSQQQEAPNVINLRTDRTQCVGGYELRLGINYTYECGNWWFRGEVGYEHDHYFDALLFVNGDVTDPARPDPVKSSTLALGGLYFGITTGF